MCVLLYFHILSTLKWPKQDIIYKIHKNPWGRVVREKKIEKETVKDRKRHREGGECQREKEREREKKK